jgi:uncharacterized protein involved in exopolysaccharide biosynthesis
MTKNLADERLLTAREAMLGAYPPPLGNEPGGLPFKRVLGALFRSRLVVGTCAGLGCAVGLFLAVTTPNTYVSQGTFLFTTSGSESINVDLTRSSDPKAEAISANAVHVLQADTLLRRVAERVGPEEILKPYQPDDNFAGGLSKLLHRIQRDWNAVDVAGATVDEALKMLRKRLVVDRSRQSDVLIATYQTHDAELAQKILGVYMKEAQKWHQEKYDDPTVYDEVKKRAEDAVKAKDLARRKLADFMDQQARVQEFDFQLERLRTEEADASARLRDNLLSIESTQKQIAELQKLLETLTPTVVVHRRLTTTKSVEVIQEEISKLEVQRTRALTTAQTADVKAFDQQIASLQGRIKQLVEDAKTAPEVDIEEDNPAYGEARATIGKLGTQLVQDHAITPELTKRKNDASTRLGKLLDLQPKFVELRDAEVAAEADAKAGAEALQRAELKKQLQLGNFSSLKVIDDASLPLEKEGPNRTKLILGGLIVGLFLGFGLVLLRTVPDRTVRTPADLEALDGVTVIGVMPRLDNRNMRRHMATRMRGW